MCVCYLSLVSDERRGGPVLHRLPHDEELLRRAPGLHKNQELHRRCGRDRAGRPISLRDAGARKGQIRRRRSVGRQEYGNLRRKDEKERDARGISSARVTGLFTPGAI